MSPAKSRRRRSATRRMARSRSVLFVARLPKSPEFAAVSSGIASPLFCRVVAGMAARSFCHGVGPFGGASAVLEDPAYRPHAHARPAGDSAPRKALLVAEPDNLQAVEDLPAPAQLLAFLPGPVQAGADRF